MALYKGLDMAVKIYSALFWRIYLRAKRAALTYGYTIAINRFDWLLDGMFPDYSDFVSINRKIFIVKISISQVNL